MPVDPFWVVETSNGAAIGRCEPAAGLAVVYQGVAATVDAVGDSSVALDDGRVIRSGGHPGSYARVLRSDLNSARDADWPLGDADGEAQGLDAISFGPQTLRPVVFLNGDGVPQTFPAGSPAPANLTPPSIDGTPLVGETLAKTPGTWAGGTPTTQWLRDGDPIGGATGDTYELVEADVGYEVSVRETVGAVTADSDPLLWAMPAALVTALPVALCRANGLLWQDAGKTTPAVADGDPVRVAVCPYTATEWPMGGGGSTPPALADKGSGHWAVQFTEADQTNLLVTTDALASQPVTVAAVFKADWASFAAKPLWGSFSTQLSALSWSAKWAMSSGAFVNAFTGDDVRTAVRCCYNGASSTAHVNGVLESTLDAGSNGGVQSFAVGGDNQGGFHDSEFEFVALIAAVLGATEGAGLDDLMAGV